MDMEENENCTLDSIVVLVVGGGRRPTDELSWASVARGVWCRCRVVWWLVGVVEKESAKESGEEEGRVRPRPPRRMSEILCALKQHSHTPLPKVTSGLSACWMDRRASCSRLFDRILGGTPTMHTNSVPNRNIIQG